MNHHNTPLPQVPSASPRPVRHLSDVQRRVTTAGQLRAQGVAVAEANEQCRPGGPWQQLLPGVYLLHPGPPTSEERLHAVLMYAGRDAATPPPAVPTQPGAGDPHRPVYKEAMITGLAALNLHGLSSAPRCCPWSTSTSWSRGCAGCARRAAPTSSVPAPCRPPEQATGVPVAPVPRALADAVAQLTDAAVVQRLLSEAVRGGHCEPTAVVRELNNAKLLSRPHVVDAVDSLLAEGRAFAEDRLYTMVCDYGLPDPVWNVDLRLPGGPHLGGLDAYWPEQAVAVELDTRAPRQDEDALWSEYARKREHLERLGITVVYITPKKLRHAMEQQAAVIRTALMASGDRDPAAYVVVLPR